MKANDAHKTAVALVTCASTEDIEGARHVLASVADQESLQMLALSLAGMCWSSVERNAAISGVEPERLWRMFAAGVAAVPPGEPSDG